MSTKNDYFKLISDRGNERGLNGGLLDLLEWCGKIGLNQVTEAEAKAFWEHPESRYEEIEA